MKSRTPAMHTAVPNYPPRARRGKHDEGDVPNRMTYAQALDAMLYVTLVLLG